MEREHEGDCKAGQGCVYGRGAGAGAVGTCSEVIAKRNTMKSRGNGGHLKQERICISTRKVVKSHSLTLVNRTRCSTMKASIWSTSFPNRFSFSSVVRWTKLLSKALQYQIDKLYGIECMLMIDYHPLLPSYHVIIRCCLRPSSPYPSKPRLGLFSVRSIEYLQRETAHLREAMSLTHSVDEPTTYLYKYEVGTEGQRHLQLR